MDYHLKIHGVGKMFGKFTALKDITFDVAKGEFICLLGPSGCGKTTLLRIMAGLEKLDGGKVVVGGKDITNLAPAKRNFGIVFQSYALFPNLTVFENVAYGLHNKKMSKAEIQDKVSEYLDLVHLFDSEHKYPSQLSGGQQQRVALARALAMSPDFLLLDEPLSALDAKVREQLRIEIRRIQQRLGITTIMVTHDQEEALTMADRIIVMDNAEIVQIGTPKEIYEQPETPTVASFIGTMNFFKGEDIGYPMNASLLAIRPEHIELGTGMNVIVEHVEYRGPFYRIFAKFFGKEEMIIIDAPTSHPLKEKFVEDAILSIHIPLRHMIKFPSNEVLLEQELAVGGM